MNNSIFKLIIFISKLKNITYILNLKYLVKSLILKIKLYKIDKIKIKNKHVINFKLKIKNT